MENMKIILFLQKIFNAIFRKGKLIDYGDGTYPPEDYNGIWEVYWPNGKIKYRSTFINGKEEGYCNCYWDNGNIAQTGEMRDGKCIGVWTDYSYDGFKSLEGAYGENGNEGIWLSFWDNGNVMSEREYKNGMQDGVFRRYSDDGVLKYHGMYRDGEPFSGICEVHTEKQDNGSYIILAEFIDGKQIRVIDLGT
jgi:antitoxin component YwqK of YwqJK toxin-antitoxin module